MNENVREMKRKLAFAREELRRLKELAEMLGPTRERVAGLAVALEEASALPVGDSVDLDRVKWNIENLQNMFETEKKREAVLIDRILGCVAIILCDLLQRPARGGMPRAATHLQSGQSRTSGTQD